MNDKITVEQFEALLPEICSIETSQSPKDWKPTNPLWGHWWCCKPCWEAMIKAGINRVFLLENSEILFNKEHPDNVVGKQFE